MKSADPASRIAYYVKTNSDELSSLDYHIARSNIIYTFTEEKIYENLFNSA